MKEVYSEIEKTYVFKVAFFIDNDVEIILEISHKSGSLENSKRIVQLCLQEYSGFQIRSVYILHDV